MWDKAPIVTSVISSVVIALVGLYVSSSFQKSQLAVTREANAAQLAITAQKNQSDVRIEELRLASQLLESLVSPDSKKRRIATLMLPSALSNQQMTQQILTALTDDSDPGVRVAAINKLGTATTQQAALALEGVHADASRPEAERALARDLATKVALNSNLPRNTAFLFASAPGGLAYELDRLGGGVFTHYLVKGLTGEADRDGDGVVRIDELAKYVDQAVPQEIGGADVLGRSVRFNPIAPKNDGSKFKPFLELSGSPDLEVISLNPGVATKRIALVVGVEEYQATSMLKLRYVRSDAQKVAETFKKVGIATTTLLDPGEAEIKGALKRIITGLSPEDSFYFYFAGHGWSTSGENMLGPSDLRTTEKGVVGGVSIEELKNLLRGTPTRASFAFFDVCRNEIVFSASR